MRAVLPWLAVVGLSIAVFVHYGNHLPQLKQLASSQSKEFDSAEKETNPAAPLLATDKAVAIVSPLQQLMDGNGGDTSEKPPEPHPLRKPNPKDLIAPSPVGTGGVILHKTFSVGSSTNFAFVIPAHAATPQLHGHYQSFTQGATPASNESADIAFLVMNEAQYADYAGSRAADTLFFVDASHDQDINFGLPSSLNQPTKFYIVFRNNPGEARKTVHADFAVEF
jgi:hypothetical protein